MKKKFRFKKTYLIIAMIVIGSITAGILWANFDEFQGNWINVTSFIISIIALIIALITYFSIDSVNSITTMEGNVLENENYTVAYTEMLRKFSDCATKEQFQNKLFTEVCEGIQQKGDTCIQFADSIQNMIDHIIWFAYLDFSDADFRKYYNKMMRTAEKRLVHYSKLSNGIQYTLHENVKLIKYVFDYQMGRNLSHGYVTSLEDVREGMIRNPMSQIVYYDYLGLHYRRKAAELFKTCGCQAPEFSREYMQFVRNYEFSAETKHNIHLLLNHAETDFTRANEIAKDDILWKNYLFFNVVRTKIMVWLLEGNNSPVSYEQIENLLNETIRVRREVKFFYDSIAGGYLKSMFEKECEYAEKLMIEFQNIDSDEMENV